MEYGRRATDQGKEDPMIVLTRIDERLRNFIERFDKHEIEDKIEFDGQNKRIAVLENDKAKIWGGAAVVAFIIGMITKWWPK